MAYCKSNFRYIYPVRDAATRTFPILDSFLPEYVILHPSYLDKGTEREILEFSRKTFEIPGLKYAVRESSKNRRQDLSNEKTKSNHLDEV